MRLEMTKHPKSHLQVKPSRVVRDAKKKSIVDAIKKSVAFENPVSKKKKPSTAETNNVETLDDIPEDGRLHSWLKKAPTSTTDMTKTKRKRLKRKEAQAQRAALRPKRPIKEEQEPPLSSSLVLPSRKGFVSQLDTDEAKLAAVRARLNEMFNNVLKIQPVPRPCPPGLIKDLCPLAISIRFPKKSGARYAFLQFRNQMELNSAQTMLSTQFLKSKPLKVTAVSAERQSDRSASWRTPEERELSDFEWNTLFITRLPRATTRLDLGQLFRKASKLRLSTFDDGTCAGSCLLTYKSTEDALQAFETRHGTFVRGSPISVNFALKSKTPVHPVKLKSVDLAELSTDASSMDVNELPAVDDEGLDVEMDDEPVQSSALQNNITEQSPTKVKVKKAKRQRVTSDSHEDDVQEKLLLPKPYQVRRKGGPSRISSNQSVLEQLLRPPPSKPKRAKRSNKKPLTKRGKASKHR